MVERKTTAFPIRDAEGRLVATHRRMDTPDGKKVWWELPDGTRGLNGTKSEDLPLYGAQFVHAWPEDALVILCEGEKACDALAAVGLPALGSVTGAGGTPGPDTLEVLRSRRVCLWPDADDAGRKHMERIAERLHGIVAEVSIYKWHEAQEKGADAADHPAVQSDDLKAVDRLLTDLEGAPRWQSTPASLSPDLNRQGRGDANRVPLRSVRFNEIPDPGPRRYLLEGLIPEGYPTLLHGDGGVAKSMLLLSFGLAVAREAEK